MVNLFVSYSYVGKQFHTFYESFGNTVLELKEDNEYTFLENLTNQINEIALKDTGMETITCTVLFFRELPK